VSEDRPVLIDRFLEDAYEADVDAVSDGERVVIGAVMQHIEDAGHPLGRLGVRAAAVRDRARPTRRRCAGRPRRSRRRSGVVGSSTCSSPVRDGVVYVLEVNPRASRTVPFVSKAVGVPLASVAAR
jgi:carbamoyl-phosphate synthase large subunit